MGILLVFLFFVNSVGCSARQGMGEPNHSSSGRPEKSRSCYYDFSDILIPAGLKLIEAESFLRKVPAMKIGVLTFRGRRKIPYLLSFFEDHMEKDHWRLIRGFSYRGSLLSFEKEERMCWIKMHRRFFTTTVEIRVGPLDREALIREGGREGIQETDL